MFAEFTGLNPNTYVPLIFADGIPSKPELENRKACVTERVKAIAREAGLSLDHINNMEVTFEISGLDLSDGSASLKGKKIVVHLSSSLLLDFKKDFLIQNSEDFKAKLENDQWIQEFANKNCKIFYNRPSKKLNGDSIFSYKTYFPRFFNPEKEAQTQLFVVLHELGHIHHGDTHNKSYRGTLALIVGFALFAFASMSLFTWTIREIVVLKPNSVFELFSMFVSRKGLAKLTPLVLSLLYNYWAKSYAEALCQKQEVRADRFALNALKGEQAQRIKEGAIHFFEKLIQEEQMIKQNWTKWQTFKYRVSSLLLPDLMTHPSDELRLKMAQQFKTKIRK